MRHSRALASLMVVIFFRVAPALGEEVNEKASDGNVELEVRWAGGLMKSGCLVQQGNIALAGEMKSDSDANYLLFVGTTIRNGQDKPLLFHLNDFHVIAGGGPLTPRAYLAGTEVFVCTSENVDFTIGPKQEKKVGVGFMAVPKSSEEVRISFRNLRDITFRRPEIK